MIRARCLSSAGPFRILRVVRDGLGDTKRTDTCATHTDMPDSAALAVDRALCCFANQNLLLSIKSSYSVSLHISDVIVWQKHVKTPLWMPVSGYGVTVS